MKKTAHKGFTLVELMIVVVIISIVLAIAIPKFSFLIAKSKEANTKGNLGSIRSALSVYYGQTEGLYPSDDLTSLLNGSQFLAEMPTAQYPTTNNSVGHIGIFKGVLTGLIPAGSNDVSDGTSGWLYDNIPGDLNYGRVIPNCTHNDYYGDLWTSF